MSTTFCAQCHRPIPHRIVRAGVVLTALKARMFDIIDTAEGISNDDINQLMFAGKASRESIKAHIWQINDALYATEWRIRSIDRYYYVTRPSRDSDSAATATGES